MQAKRALGFRACLALVVGNLIGSGIYLLPASLAPLGWNAFVGWVVTAIGALCLAIVFARLAEHLPAEGGPYAYTRAAFGKPAGFIVAWSYWTMVWVGNGAVAVAVVSALSGAFPDLAQSTGAPAALAIAVVWLLTFVNIRGIGTAALVQSVTTILKIFPLLAVAVLGAVLLGGSGGGAIPAQPDVPLAAGSVATAAALCFWGFLGLESATIPADKVRDPRRTIPRATLWGTALVGILYLLVTAMVMLLMPQESAARSPAPLADFIGTYWGRGAGALVALFAAVSAFGTLNGFILIQGEMPWAMARGGVFPAWLAKVGPRGTPVRAHLVSSGLLTIVTLMNYTSTLGELFGVLATVSIASGLVAYLLTMLAAAKLLPRDRLVWPCVPVTAGFIFWMIWGLGLQAILWGFVLLVAGLPIYAWVRRNAEGKAGPAAPDP